MDSLYFDNMTKSRRNHAKTMRNRSKKPRNYGIRYSPANLDDSFPISGGMIHTQGDEPITFLHMHDCLEIGICHDGAGVFVVEEKVLSFAAGDVNIINQEERHLAQSMPGTTSHWTFIMLDPARLAGVLTTEHEVLRTSGLCGPDFCNIISPRDQPGLAEIVLDLARELQTREPGYRSCVRGLVLTMMVRLHRCRGRHAEAPDRAGSNKPEAVERIAPALHYLAENYCRQIAVTELANLCHVSVASLRRMFHAATGMSPQQYLTRLRIQMAASMLQGTARPVLQIACDVGYPSLSSFNRHFRRLTGMAPREWRQRKGES